MSIPTRVWVVGLVVSLGWIFALGWDKRSRVVAGLLALSTLVTTAVCARVAATWHTRRAVKLKPVPLDANPADGVVEVTPVSGAEGVPLLRVPAFRRFTGIVQFYPSVVPRVLPNPPFLGRVVMVSVFVGRDGVSWSDAEIEAGLASLERAGAWFEREAIRQDVPLNLALADVYFQANDEETDLVELAFEPDGDDFGPMEANSTTKAVVLASRIAAKLGFVDVADWMARINERIAADAVVWLFHVRRAGRSMAILADGSGMADVGFALCYAKEASFPEPLRGRARVDPTTIAHEMLHLFGATDKYNVALGSFSRGGVSSRDIMRLNHDSLSRMRIDKLTASEVGWLVPG